MQCLLLALTESRTEEIVYCYELVVISLSKVIGDDHDGGHTSAYGNIEDMKMNFSGIDIDDTPQIMDKSHQRADGNSPPHHHKGMKNNDARYE